MVPGPEPTATHAVRCVARGDVVATGLRDAVVSRARELGVLGWIREADTGEVLMHAEGGEDSVEELVSFFGTDRGTTRIEGVEVEPVKPEGHEQFAVRGVSAGRFEVVEETSRRGGFELCLAVEGAMRVWALPKGPSMDPAVKRMAFELERGSDQAGSIWDEGTYEQGGRVPWPEAIERGHAVFVLHGAHLRGGFALQRIRAGSTPQWLLIKRTDEHARRGSDVVSESQR